MPSFIFFDYNKEKIVEYREILKSHIDAQFYYGTLVDVMKNFDINVLVSPANSYGIMTGGIDRDIVEMYPMVIDNVNAKINQSSDFDSGGRKIIPVGRCEAVSLNNKDKIMLIAPTMFLPKNIEGTFNVFHAFSAILKLTDKLPKNVLIACPCLGTGVGGLSGTKSAMQILRAIQLHKKN